MRSDSVRAKLARSIDPTKEINVIVGAVHHPNYPQFEALAVARRAYTRLKRVVIYDLLVTAQPAQRVWKEHHPYVLKEFKYDERAIDRQKDPEASYRGLYERATQRLNELRNNRDNDEHRQIAFILLDRDASKFFSGLPVSLRLEIRDQYTKRNPQTTYHVSDDVVYDTYSHGFRHSRMEHPPTAFGPNTILAFGDHKHVKLVCVPPVLKRVCYVRLNDHEAEMMSMGELIDYEFYQRYLWAGQESRDQMTAELGWLSRGDDSPAELVGNAVRCLAEFGEELSSARFIAKLTKESELVHDLPASELLEEIWDSPGLFKIVRGRFVLNENKSAQLYSDVLEEIDDFIKSEASRAFEEGRFNTYSDVCVPGVKRDFTFSFCRANDSSTYTVSFTHQVD